MVFNGEDGAASLFFFRLSINSNATTKLNGLGEHISEISGAVAAHISSPASPVFSTNAIFLVLVFFVYDFFDRDFFVSIFAPLPR